MVIIGGLGNIYGVVAGAIVLSIFPEFLREYGGHKKACGISIEKNQIENSARP